jgi:Family of unknown function (DUF6152)
MKTPTVFLTMAVGLLLAVAPGWAHHPVEADYDNDKPIVLKGTVTKVEWKNPHVRIHLDGGTGRAPASMDWDVELASPNLLAMGGFKISNLRPGDHLTVDAYPARDGSNAAYAKKVTRNR